MSANGRRNRAGSDIQLHQKAQKCVDDTHFNYDECLALLKMHGFLTSREQIDRMRFRSILYASLEITDSFMLDRIYRVADRNDDGIIDALEWVTVLSVLLRGTLNELIEFCYTVYDVNGDRSLAREELTMCFDRCFKARADLDQSEVEEAIQDLVQIAMNKLDVDKDGVITFTDYKAAVENNPVLLQCCGTCLPPPRLIKGFQYLFTWDYNNYYNAFEDPDKFTSEDAKGKSLMPMPTERSDYRFDFGSDSHNLQPHQDTTV